VFLALPVESVCAVTHDTIRKYYQGDQRGGFFRYKLLKLGGDTDWSVDCSPPFANPQLLRPPGLRSLPLDLSSDEGSYRGWLGWTDYLWCWSYQQCCDKRGLGTILHQVGLRVRHVTRKDWQKGTKVNCAVGGLLLWAM
jgi:hypothetical protein